jgi:hypothetical protein
LPLCVWQWVMSVGQHPPAHQLGILSAGFVGISHLVVEYVLTSVDVFGVTFSLVLFFPILRSPAQLHTTCLLGPTYQLRTNSAPSLTYLPIGFTLPFPPKLVTSFLPTFPPSLPPTYLPNTYIVSIRTNENN